MGWSASLAVVAAAAATQTPQADALGLSAVQGAAVRHLGLEVLCACLAVSVLYMGLRRSKPRAAGHFLYSIEPQVGLTVLAVAALSYPLADPVLYDACRAAEEALAQLGLPLAAPASTGGGGLVSQLREAAAAGDGGSLALHALASCGVGPFWEETFWRGFFLASMTRVLPLPACVAASSLGFAALHAAPGNLLPIALMSGLCDVLYLRTARLGAPLALHAGWNAYQLAAIVWAGKESFV